MPRDLGDTVRLTADSKDAGGTLTDATGAVLTITLPDGTTETPTVTNPPAVTGRYTVDYTTVQAGLHQIRWVFTGPASAYTDALDVREAVPPLMMSLADAKNQLNMSASVTTHDEELRHFVESTTRAVEFHVGPVVRRTFTDRRNCGRPRVALLRSPVIALTAVEPVGTWQLDVDLAVLDVDETTGIVTRTDGLSFPPGQYDFTYTAGRVVVGANLALAARVILQHLWRTQRPGSRRATGGDDYAVTEPIPGLGFAIPHRALQLMLDDNDPEGIA